MPTVNAQEIERIARRALKAGAERMDIVPHVEVPGAPLLRGGVPTATELERARREVDEVFGKAARGRLPGTGTPGPGSYATSSKRCSSSTRW